MLGLWTGIGTTETRMDDGFGDLKLTMTEQCIVAVKYVNRVPTVVKYVHCNCSLELSSQTNCECILVCS